MLILQILFVLAAIAVVILYAFSLCAIMYYVFAPFVRRNQLRILLKKTGEDRHSLCARIKKDLCEMPGFQELQQFNLRISCCADAHDAAIDFDPNIITISSIWIVNYYKRNYANFRDYKDFCMTIGHELGHYHYKDNRLPPFTRKNRMIHILREVRADIYGRIICGFSPEEASAMLRQELESNKQPLKERIILTHPSWEDRLNYLKQHADYDKTLEMLVKDDYQKSLHISKLMGERISLIHE